MVNRRTFVGLLIALHLFVAISGIRAAYAGLPALALVPSLVASNGARVALTAGMEWSGLINTVGAVALLFAFSDVNKTVAVPISSDTVSFDSEFPPPVAEPVMQNSAVSGFQFAPLDVFYPDWHTALTGDSGFLNPEDGKLYATPVHALEMLLWGMAQTDLALGYTSNYAVTDIHVGTTPLSWAPAGYFVGTVVDTENGDSWTEYIAYQGTVGCPSGYESTGSGACELLNPRSAQPDSRVDITRGNTYTHDDIDSLPSGVRISGGKVIIEGVNPEGQAHRYTVSPSSVDTVITHQVQTSPTSIQVQRMTLSMPGDIVAVDSYTEAGSISTTTTTPGTGMEWPSDYARQHEAGQAADRVIEELRDVKKFTVFEKLLSWFETEDVPTLPQSDDYEETLRGEFEGLLTWRLPDHSSECPTPTFHIFDQAHVMDSHCFLLEQNRGLIALILQAMFTISALFVVLGA